MSNNEKFDREDEGYAGTFIKIVASALYRVLNSEADCQRELVITARFNENNELTSYDAEIKEAGSSKPD
jgi:hypothetical protein